MYRLIDLTIQTCIKQYQQFIQQEMKIAPRLLAL